MNENTAAWLAAPGAKLAVGPAPSTAPRENEIVVENYAVAVNPIDWIKQTAGDFIFSYIEYPFVLGSDLAGMVVEVGAGVTRFKVGDRVLGHAVGTDPGRNSATEGSFQRYTVVPAGMAAPIPAGMSFENAAVLPLGLSTAACGLFEKNQLALQHPTLSPQPTGKTLLVWGGSTSVGSNAIQLGVAAGYEVITTASPRNFDYVKKLGASMAFDYADKDVVRSIIAAFAGKTLAGAIAIGAGSAQACIDVAGACSGNRFVSIATFPISFERIAQYPGRLRLVLALVPRFLAANIALWFRARAKGVRTSSIFGSSLMYNEVGHAIYVDFLPEALEQRRYLAAPDPLVVGNGLESVQQGFDIAKKGMSAAKVVISLRTPT